MIETCGLVKSICIIRMSRWPERGFKLRTKLILRCPSNRLASYYSWLTHVSHFVLGFFIPPSWNSSIFILFFYQIASFLELCFIATISFIDFYKPFHPIHSTHLSFMASFLLLVPKPQVTIKFVLTTLSSFNSFLLFPIIPIVFIICNSYFSVFHGTISRGLPCNLLTVSNNYSADLSYPLFSLVETVDSYCCDVVRASEIRLSQWTGCVCSQRVIDFSAVEHKQEDKITKQTQTNSEVLKSVLLCRYLQCEVYIAKKIYSLLTVYFLS